MSTVRNSGCEPHQFAEPDSTLVDDLTPSPNIGERRGGLRTTHLILHYTGLESARHSIEVLTDSRCEVSCHYLVDVDGRTTQMVREADRAWHAGHSYWRGERDINSASIGIEIQNPGHAAGYPDFPAAQMVAVERLCLDIMSRHPIAPECVLAHSDIAPQRKIDPGEKFAWARLHEAGIGHRVRPHPLEASAMPADRPPSETTVRHCQALLAAYGYEIAIDGCFDDATRRVISAFQRHFRPSLVDGLPDQSTIATLIDLCASAGRMPET